MQEHKCILLQPNHPPPGYDSAREFSSLLLQHRELLPGAPMREPAKAILGPRFMAGDPPTLKSKKRRMKWAITTEAESLIVIV